MTSCLLCPCPRPRQDVVLHFFAKSFSSSPLKMTREIYTILGSVLGGGVDALLFRSPP